MIARSSILLVSTLLSCAVTVTNSPAFASFDQDPCTVIAQGGSDEQTANPSLKPGNGPGRLRPLKRLRQSLKNGGGPFSAEYEQQADSGTQPAQNTPVGLPPELSYVDQNNVSGKALSLILNDKVDEAKDSLIKAYNEDKRKGTRNPEIPYFLAAIDAHTDKFGQAIKFLTEAQGLFKANKCDASTEVLIGKRLGDCYYKNKDMKTALQHYQSALYEAQEQKTSLPPFIICEILESIVGCEIYLKQYDDAEKHCQAHIDLCKYMLSSGGIPAYLDYSWSMIQMSELLKKAGKKEKFLKAQDEAHKLMGQLAEARMLLEARQNMPAYEELVKQFRVLYVTALSPSTPADIAWAGHDFRVKTLPVIFWKPVDDPIAAIICIHGLGLENRSFTETAKRLAQRGYLVSALDVRGFGAWVESRGDEELDYDSCLQDIKDLIAILKSKNPGVPMYILGESMGGAIALRAAAELGSELRGVISSVPSAERFQQKQMSLKTAMHFIVDPKKAFDVGSYVAERATTEEETLDKWTNDQKAKLQLTPVELIKFDAFMKMTRRKAQDIKGVPVLMLQGLKDRLVKPKGTFELFEAVGSEDKSIIVQGLAEHLMFENAHPDATIIDTVDSWLRQHNAQDPKSKATAQ